jgi:DNA-binding CsgD family transcriptional regulator
MRLAIVERPGGEVTRSIGAASIPGVDVVAAGPLARLATSSGFPTDVVLVVDDGDVDAVAARIGVCRLLGAGVIVLQDKADPVALARFAEAGASVLDELAGVVEILARGDSVSGAWRPRMLRTAEGRHRPLSPAESRVFAMSEAGVSRAETARQLSVTGETVKTLLRRAREKRAGIRMADGSD